eukprot:9223620-Alexandrium_andersonii.AAC.1
MLSPPQRVPWRPTEGAKVLSLAKHLEGRGAPTDQTILQRARAALQAYEALCVPVTGLRGRSRSRT